MKRMQKVVRGLGLLALIFIMVGCSNPTVVVQPTADLPAVRTEAAQTVVARLTIEAALNPTDTPVPAEPIVITATAAPTEEAAQPTAAAPTEAEPTAAAPTETPAVSAPPTATLIPTRPPSTGGPVPTRTRRAGPDQAELIAQEPRDGTVYRAGEEFDARWTVRNIGTSTWTVNYDLRFARGTQLAKADMYALSKEVKPGESIALIADMVAPPDAGRYVSYWEITNENGNVFYTFYVIIDVQ